MAQELFCRYSGCGFSCVAVAGNLPATCRSCGRPSRWSTEPVLSTTATGKPRVKYDLTLNDRRFLRGLRIKPEMKM